MKTTLKEGLLNQQHNTHLHTYINIYIYIWYMCIHYIYTCKHTCICIYTYFLFYLFIYFFIYLFIVFIYVYIYMYIYIYICIYICIYMYIYIYSTSCCSVSPVGSVFCSCPAMSFAGAESQSLNIVGGCKESCDCHRWDLVTTSEIWPKRGNGFCRQSHTVLLRNDGCAVAFGNNSDHEQCSIPPLDDGMMYTQVSAGHRHTVLLKNDGSAIAFGDNRGGQCDLPPLDSAIFHLWGLNSPTVLHPDFCSWHHTTGAGDVLEVKSPEGERIEVVVPEDTEAGRRWLLRVQEASRRRWISVGRPPSKTKYDQRSQSNKTQRKEAKETSLLKSRQIPLHCYQ